MKKWSEIKQAILDKLFLEENEAEQVNYLSKFRYLANECLTIIANGIKPRIAVYEVVTEKNGDVVVMPEDFLSFADMVGTRDGVLETDVVYLSDREIAFPLKGTHRIYYNALWKEITKNDVIEDTELPIDLSVIQCIPTYVASQILSQDDIQRSSVLKNEFELLLARLDTNILYEENHYHSVGGWY